MWHRISFLPTSRKNPLAVASRKLFVSPFHRVSHLMRPRFSFPSFPPFPVLSTSNSLTRGSISPSLIQRAWKGLSRIVCYLHYYICTRGGGGGYSWFQVTGTIEWGQKSKPKKIPWAQQNQKKIPGLKISPKKSHAEFPGLKKPSHKTSLVRVTGALEHFQKIPMAVNQATQKILTKFSCPKKSQNGKFQPPPPPKKNLRSSPSLEIWIPPLVIVYCIYYRERKEVLRGQKLDMWIIN